MAKWAHYFSHKSKQISQIRQSFVKFIKSLLNIVVIKTELWDIYSVVKKTNVHTIFEITKILKRLIVLTLTHSLTNSRILSLTVYIYPCNKIKKSLSFSLKSIAPTWALSQALAVVRRKCWHGRDVVERASWLFVLGYKFFAQNCPSFSWR